MTVRRGRSTARLVLAVLVAGTALALGEPAAPQPDEEGSHLVVVRQTPFVAPGGTWAIRLRVDDPPRGA